MTTYRDACHRLGLLQDDVETLNMLREAVRCASRTAAEELFAEALVWLDVADPTRLWRDFLSLLRDSGDRAYEGLAEHGDVAAGVYDRVDAVLAHYKFTLATWGLARPSVDEPVTEPAVSRQETMWRRELAAERPDAARREACAARCEELTLNSEQEAVYLSVREAIDAARLYRDARVGAPPKKHRFFVDGPAGTGKTYLY